MSLLLPHTTAPSRILQLRTQKDDKEYINSMILTPRKNYTRTNNSYVRAEENTGTHRMR